MSSQPQASAADRPLVLVVDDSVELGMIVKVLGRRAGQEVVLCPDATSAWRVLPDRPPSLTLIDVNLPGLSGLELCRMIRSTPGLSELSLALFSHWQMPQDVLAGLEAGVDFVVNKELVTNPEAWQTRLREILSWQRGQRGEQLVSWLRKTALPELSGTWVTNLNQALCHPSLARLRPQVLRFLLLRSLRREWSSRLAGTDLESWVAPDDALLARNRFGLVPGSPEKRVSVDDVCRLVVTLAEQTWCLLGTEATADFRSALASVVPGLEEVLAFS